MQLGSRKALPVVVAAVKSESARRIRRASGESLTVWQRGYFDRAMRRDEDVVAVARYIVANPLRAGLVASISEYPHWDVCWM
jgi:REP element-mobilizing transposase RayT